MTCAPSGGWSALRSSCDFGVIVHGPEAIYSGEVEMAMAFLSTLGSVRAAGAGTMCRTAVIDRALENIIDIARCDLPSRAIASFHCSVPVIVNNGKTLESGIAFGDIVSGRAQKTAVQAERLAEKDGTIILWEVEANERARRLAEDMAAHFGVPLERRSPSVDRDNEAGHDIRCACPGEPLFINGIFVGTVTGPVVRALARDGRIDCIEGVEIKETGLEKVRGLSMDEVKFKSGHIRKKAYAPLLCPVREGEGRMAVIDHLAFYSLDAIAPDTVCALTVGDDTTEVAGDVLARRGIRIIGITDGDKDGILGEAVRARGSVILRVKGTTDDEAGAALARAVGGRDTFQGFVGRIKSELERMRVTYEAYP